MRAMMNISKYQGWVLIALVVFFGFHLTKIINDRSRYISTNGVAFRCVEADLAVWVLTCENETDDVKDIMEKRQNDKEAIFKFLRDRGISESDIKVLPAHVENIQQNNHDNKKYKVVDSYEIKSRDPYIIEKAIGEAIILSQEGVIIPGDQYSSPVRYIYNDIAKLRLDLIGEALADAQKRADRISEASHTKIKTLRNFTSGYFSIVAEDALGHDDSYSRGEYKAIKKFVRVVVHCNYDIESSIFW
jgi:hypothetical protein